MKLPSLQSLFSGLKMVFLRFPLQVAVALLGIIISWHIIDVNQNDEATTWVISLCCCNFALTLLIAADLFCEVNQYRAGKKWLARVLAVAISIGLYFALDPQQNEADIFRIFIFLVAFHLLVAFAPYIGKSDLNGFWQYNKQLFLRFLLAALYAAVLFAGLAIALGVVHLLFKVEISYRWYLKLFAFVASGFSTVFFLAGVPADFKNLQNDHSYPKGLKIFTQYVLIPLMTIYLGILLTYELKIIVEWSMPKGLVSYLILGYAIFGILSLLLVYPIKDQDGNAWIRLFSRFFYLMMIPLLILLLLAIGKRVSDYGVTESRYILIALGIWLTAITGYFLFSKKQNIKLIPVSLCLVALFITYGPQSAFSISKYSQTTRLKMLMSSKKQGDVDERASVVRYLIERHGFTAMQPFTKVDLNELEKQIDAKAKRNKQQDYEINLKKRDTIFSLLKISDNYNSNEQYHFNLVNSKKGNVDVKGYDVLFEILDNTDSVKTFDGKIFRFKYVSEAKGKKDNLSILKVMIDNESPIYFNVSKIADTAVSKFSLREGNKYADFVYDSERLNIFQQTNQYDFKLVISQMDGFVDHKHRGFDWFNFKAHLLVKKK